MITIGICDDESIVRQHIKELCDSFFAERSLPYECIEFASGEEFLNYDDNPIDYTINMSFIQKYLFFELY